jgi:hypothetical protein
VTMVEGAHARRVHTRPVPRVEPRQHREDVIARLLDLGISPATLRTILPDFRSLVDRVASRR